MIIVNREQMSIINREQAAIVIQVQIYNHSEPEIDDKTGHS